MALIHKHFPVMMSDFGPHAVISIDSTESYFGPYAQPGFHVADHTFEEDEDE